MHWTCYNCGNETEMAMCVGSGVFIIYAGIIIGAIILAYIMLAWQNKKEREKLGGIGNE